VSSSQIIVTLNNSVAQSSRKFANRKDLRETHHHHRQRRQQISTARTYIEKIVYNNNYLLRPRRVSSRPICRFRFIDISTVHTCSSHHRYWSLLSRYVKLGKPSVEDLMVLYKMSATAVELIVTVVEILCIGTYLIANRNVRSATDCSRYL